LKRRSEEKPPDRLRRRGCCRRPVQSSGP
jgi:hypothetical protein